MYDDDDDNPLESDRDFRHEIARDYGTAPSGEPRPLLVIPVIYRRAMSIDTTILIAGEPVLVLAEGLKSLEFNVVDGEHVRLMPRVRPEGDAAWRRAVEYHTGQPFTPTGSAEVQHRQSNAFLLVLKELVATLQPSGGQR